MANKQKTRSTREQRKARRQEEFTAVRRQAKEHPKLTATYFVLRLLVLAVMVLEALKGNYYNVFLCGLTLVLFLIPTFVEHRLHIEVPNTLEVIILLFIFSAEILGGNPGVLPHLPLLGHHAPHHERLSDGGHRRGHGGHPQPLG